MLHLDPIFHMSFGKSRQRRTQHSQIIDLFHKSIDRLPKNLNLPTEIVGEKYPRKRVLMQ